MTLLLDTHTLLWWLFDDPRLSEPARQALANPENQVLVSAASGWEITTKHRIGKLPEAGDVPANLLEYVARAGFAPLSISLTHAVAAGRLDGPHRDPFDRMLAAQALVEGIALVTTDRVFADWSVQTLW